MLLPTPSPSGGSLRPLGMRMGNREALCPQRIHSFFFPYCPELRKGPGGCSCRTPPKNHGLSGSFLYLFADEECEQSSQGSVTCTYIRVCVACVLP